MASKGKKPVADSFSSSQPGYISVAGESFFLNLPTDDTNTIESRLHDDSIKGDIAFQRLYLGDKSKEEDSKAPFTKQEQVDLRRIFRAIFGVGSGPTKKGISLPCSKKDLDLLLKSLEIRRKNLISQITTYDALASPDVHAKYMREHLIRLNKLIGEEIPTTLAPCKSTDVIDPNAPPRLPLDDKRMLRLLEIFAYLLAQGKDPLSEFQKTLPQPYDILPKMAVKNAPGLKEYEDAYTKANPHKVPEYTETLLKIKKILQGDVSTGDATVDKQIQQAFEAIEKALSITDTTGSYSDRADRVIKRIQTMGDEKKADIAELMKARTDLAKKQEEYDALALKEKECQDQLTKLKEEKAALEATAAKLTSDLAAINDKLKSSEAGLAAAQESIKKLEEALAAAVEAKAAAEKTLTAANEAKAAAEAALAAANDVKAAAEAALAAATATIAKLQEDLKAAEAAKLRAESELATANSTIETLTDELKEAKAAEAAALARNSELQEQKNALQAQVDTLTSDIREKDVEITELTRQLNAKKAQLDALLEIVPELDPARLRELLDAEGLVETLNTQIKDLRTKLAACPNDEEFRRLQGLVEELQRRPTQDAYDTLQANVADLRRQFQEQKDKADNLQPFEDLVRQLEGLLKDKLTIERFTELLRAKESIAGLQAKISELEGRPNITQADYETLEGQLRDARARIEELQGRGDISNEDLEELQDNFQKAVDELEDAQESLEQAQRGLEIARGVIERLKLQRAELEGQLKVANQKLAECEETKRKLTDTQLQLVAKQTEVGNLTRKIASLEERIKKASGDEATIRTLTDQKMIAEAALEKMRKDYTASQSEVTRLTKELAATVIELDARPTQKALDDMTAARNAAIGERDARPTQKALDDMTAARNAAIANQETLKTRVAALEAQISTEGVYKTVYTRLKEILGIADGIDLPNESQVNELLKNVQGRITAASSGANKTHLCLLNVLYTLLRRLTSKQGITTDSGVHFTPEQVQKMFTSIGGKAATPINESVLLLFANVLKTLLQNGIPLRGELIVIPPSELPQFNTIYTEINRLLETAPYFTNDDKACASVFLNQFFTGEYDFTTLYLKSTGRVKLKDEGEDLGLVNFASFFLLILTSTQQILDTHRKIIEDAGCLIPSVDLKRATPPPVKPPASDEEVITEEKRCRPGPVKGTTFKRVAMPGPVLFDRLKATNPNELKRLFTYLEQIKDSDPPVGPLCKLSYDMLPSEFDTHQKLVNLYGKRPPWHVALLPYKKEMPRVDPASIKPAAGLPTQYGGGGGGTRKRKTVKKRQTKKMRKA